MIITITFRSDTHATLTALNKVYKKGEPVWETDTKRLFVGDGVAPFTGLPVVAADIETLTDLSNAAVAAAIDAAQSAADAAASAGGGTAATTTTPGVTRLSTEAEAVSGTDDTIAVTPLALQAALDALTIPTVGPADTTTQGVVELATTTEASTGTDNVRAVTPAGVAAAITALGAVTPDASSTVKGKVELATNTEASTGTDTVRAVTPAGVAAAISARTATATAAGIVELATPTETQTGTDNTRAVTPAGVAAVAAGLSTVSAANISDATAPGRALLTAVDVAAQLVDLGLETAALTDADNDFTGTNTFPAGSIDPAALGALDQILADDRLANRVVSFRTYAFGTTPTITPNTLWGELASGVTPSPTDTLITHQASTLDQSTYNFDPGAIPAASVYTLWIYTGDANAGTMPADMPSSVAGRGLTWTAIGAGATQANGTTSLIAYRGTGTPTSSGNITITYPGVNQGCHIELIATSAVNPVPAAQAYNGQSGSFAAPTVHLSAAPAGTAHQLAFLGANNGSGTTTTDPGTPFGTSPDISTTAPSMRSRASVLGTPAQDPTWAKSDSGQPVTGTVVYTPA